MNQRITRRSVLKGSVAVAAAASLHGFTARSYGNILGANSDIRMGVIGFNGRGKSHIQAFSHMPGVRMVALCDADQAVLAKGVKELEAGPSTKPSKSTTKPSKSATKPVARADDRKSMVGPEDAPKGKTATKILAFGDLRKLLDSKEIDAISTATPNHWHALVTVWACQAGKDVYVEKPVSHEVWEGQQMIAAAKKYDRIVQTGTQTRSNMALKAAYEWVQAGNLGKIKISRGLCYKRRGTIGKVDGPGKVPETVNYDLWSGPAPLQDPHRKQFHYDWHWKWAYGNGDLGNQGIHQMDTARWALGKSTLAPRVLSVGGRFGYEDDGETPNTQFVIQDYGDSMLIFEVRGLPKEKVGQMDKYKGKDIGTVVECENGYLTDAGYTSEPMAYDNEGQLVKKFKLERGEQDIAEEGNGSHFANFITAVRSRKTSDLHAPITEGHLSSAMCHTGNISYRLGKPTPEAEIANALKDNKGATETYERFKEHLEKNEISLKDNQAVLGAFLEMDTKTERFTNNEQANAMLKRQYRAPYVLPDNV
jgi:predicted dehydrogenase